MKCKCGEEMTVMESITNISKAYIMIRNNVANTTSIYCGLFYLHYYCDKCGRYASGYNGNISWYESEATKKYLEMWRRIQHDL